VYTTGIKIMTEVNVNREVLDAYSTYSYRLKFPIGDNKVWVKEILQWESRILEKTSQDKLDAYGVATPPNLLNQPVFDELKSGISNIVNLILKPLYIDGVEIVYNDSWANIFRKGDYAPLHIHEDSHWSCVYYLTATGNSPLYFKDPRALPVMDSSVPLLKNKYHTLTQKKEFSSGELILFPSWLEHGVMENKTDDVRVSLASNFRVIMK